MVFDTESTSSQGSGPSSKSKDRPVEIVVMPVAPGELSWYTIKWYKNHIHREGHFLHVIHVPEIVMNNREYAGAEGVLAILQQANGVAAQLKVDYEAFLTKHSLQGRFMRVGARLKWAGIVEYAKTVNASLIIMGSENLRPMDDDERHYSFLRAQGSMSTTSKRRSTTLKLARKPSAHDMPGTFGVTHDVLMHTDVPVIVIRK